MKINLNGWTTAETLPKVQGDYIAAYYYDSRIYLSQRTHTLVSVLNEIEHLRKLYGAENAFYKLEQLPEIVK